MINSIITDGFFYRIFFFSWWIRGRARFFRFFFIMLTIINGNLFSELKLGYFWLSKTMQLPCIIDGNINQPCPNTAPPLFTFVRNTVFDTFWSRRSTPHMYLLYSVIAHGRGNPTFFRANLQYLETIDVGCMPKHLMLLKRPRCWPISSNGYHFRPLFLIDRILVFLFFHFGFQR